MAVPKRKILNITLPIDGMKKKERTGHVQEKDNKFINRANGHTHWVAPGNNVDAFESVRLKEKKPNVVYFFLMKH